MTAIGTQEVRAGLGYWLAGYRTMVRFEAANLRSFLVVALILQLLTGAGMAYIYGFYLGDVPPVARLFIVSGIPALALIPVGFALVPGAIGQHKLRETYDYVWSLPVPRLASAAATFTIFTGLAIPGSVVSLWIADVRYAVDLQVSWTVVPAVLLTSLVATSVGFAAGHAIPDPRVTNLLTNMVLFLALLFSPIVVPIEQFPDWWAAVHRLLPFAHMANVIRSSLTDGLVSGVSASWAVLATWTVLAWGLAAWVVGRRD